MKTYAVFGEIMLRLSPPGRERLFQSPSLRAQFGGAEANVAVSLARFGHPARYISVVPRNAVGDAALAELNKHGLDTSGVVRQGKRLGIYFAETGANHRPSLVIYDREHSALAEAKAGDIDWNRALAGVDWFHTTGITPALSPTSADLTLEAMRRAKALGAVTSLDLNYRAKLWNYGRSAPEVMRELVKFAELVVANEEDIPLSLGIAGETGNEAPGRPADIRAAERLAAEVLTQFPNVSRVAVTVRESFGADHNRWSAVLATARRFLVSRTYDIPDIVDRIGSGDAFAAGLLHGLEAFSSEEEALEFAAAASCLKHSIPGDFNLVSAQDVLSLAKGEASGRIRR